MRDSAGAGGGRRFGTDTFRGQTGSANVFQPRQKKGLFGRWRSSRIGVKATPVLAVRRRAHPPAIFGPAQ